MVKYSDMAECGTLGRNNVIKLCWAKNKFANNITAHLQLFVCVVKYL